MISFSFKITNVLEQLPSFAFFSRNAIFPTVLNLLADVNIFINY